MSSTNNQNPAPAHRPAGLQWSDRLPANQQIPYDHVIAQTPFGRILITWKGWKERDCPTVDEFPGDFFAVGYDLTEAKKLAEDEWIRRVGSCF